MVRGDKAITNIIKYQKDTNLQLRRRPFERVTRETVAKIVLEITTRKQRHLAFQAKAITLLQVAAEAYLTDLFEKAGFVAHTNNRKTVLLKDVELVKLILR
jgi:histone H3